MRMWNHDIVLLALRESPCPFHRLNGQNIGTNGYWSIVIPHNQLCTTPSFSVLYNYLHIGHAFETENGTGHFLHIHLAWHCTIPGFYSSYLKKTVHLSTTCVPLRERAYLHVCTFERKIVPCSQQRSFHNSRVAKRVPDHVRYDGINHFVGEAKKTRCGVCGKTVQKKCTKCKINLHERCFAAFHGLTE